jgi:uncharacterized membrane protein
MITVEFLILRLVHVVCGVFWIGSGLYSTWFLVPAPTAAGPAIAGPVFGQLQKRHLFTVMPAVAVLTILSGLRLMMIVSANFSSAYFTTSSGLAFAVAGAAAVFAFLLTMFVSRPANIRAGKLSALLASAAESERAGLAHQRAAAQKRGTISTNIAMVLLLISAAGMALARYL